MMTSFPAVTTPPTLSARFPSFARRMSFPASIRPAILAMPVKFAVTSLLAEMMPPCATEKPPTPPSVTAPPSAIRRPSAPTSRLALPLELNPMSPRCDEMRPSIAALFVALSVIAPVASTVPSAVKLAPVRLTEAPSTVLPCSSKSDVPLLKPIASLETRLPVRLNAPVAPRRIAPGAVRLPAMLIDAAFALMPPVPNSFTARLTSSAPRSARRLITPPLSILALISSAPLVAFTSTSLFATTSPEIDTAAPLIFAVVPASTRLPMLASPFDESVTLPRLLVTLPLFRLSADAALTRILPPA